MNPEIKMSVSEADAKQIEEIKEYNSKVRRWCRKIQICAGLLTFVYNTGTWITWLFCPA